MNFDASQIYSSLRGHIDYFDPIHGIRGWAIDMERPELRLDVELVLEGVVLGTAVTSEYRQDVVDELGLNCRPGFSFRSETLDVVDLMRLIYPDSELNFFIRELSDQIPVRKKLSDYRAPGFDMLVEPMIGLGLDSARPTRGRKYRRDEGDRHAEQRGFIESITVDRNGLTWFVGWATDISHEQFDIVIVGETETPGHMVLARYDRPDIEQLPSTAFGFIAVVKTDWRGQNSDFSVHAADHGISLKSSSTARSITDVQLVAEFADEPLKGVHRDSIHYLLQRLAQRPEKPTSTDAAAAFVEEIIYLPGFGCFVRGWALGFQQKITALSVMCGHLAIRCDHKTYTTTERLDLRSAFPGYESITDRAGFMGVFRTNGEIPDDWRNASFVVEFDDLSFFQVKIPTANVKKLGYSASLDALISVYKALEKEHYFNEFALSLRKELSKAINPALAYISNRACSLLIVVVDDDRSMLFKLASDIRRRLSTGGLSFGIAFVVGPKVDRADALRVLVPLCRRPGSLNSLFFTEDVTDIYYQLPEILANVGARKFAFCDANIYIKERGWEQLQHSVDHFDNKLSVLAIRTSSGNLNQTSSLSFFAWSTISYIVWLQSIGYYVGGFAGESLRSLSIEKFDVIEDCALQLSDNSKSDLLRRINGVENDNRT